MSDLVMIETAVIADELQKVVDASELHAALNVERGFADWICSAISKWGYVEGEDFTGVNSGGGTRYLFALDMAKELALFEKTQPGMRVRRYLIAAMEESRTFYVLKHRSTNARIH